MHYFDPMLYKPNPEFSQYQTSYLTSFNSSYQDIDPCGEPLQFAQGEHFDEPHFEPMQEAVDWFSGRDWYYYYKGLTDKRGYQRIESSYNDGSTWLDRYGTYFVTGWAEDKDLIPQGYGYSQYVTENGSPQEPYNCYFGGGQDMEKPVYEDGQWHVSGFDVVYAANEYYHDHRNGKPHTAPDDDNWEELRLMESIFGNWSCLVTVDPES